MSETIKISGVWLRCSPDHVTVSVEVDGSWRLIIEDDYPASPLSWVVEPFGMMTAPLDTKADEADVR